MNKTTEELDIVDILWRIHNAPDAGIASELGDLNVLNLSLAQGQKIQLALLQRWLDNGEQLGGWKIGMTSGASRNAMGDGIRPFGFILASRIKTKGDTMSVAALHKGQVENELCFCMDKPLGANATADSARASVRAVLPAFEINQKRLPADAPAGLRVADNLSNWGIAIGEGSPPPAHIQDLDDMTVTLSGSDGVIEQVASAGHIDNHFRSIATLARSLSDYGHALQPGQYVITGAYGKTPFAPGIYCGDFGPDIGAVEVQLTT